MELFTPGHLVVIAIIALVLFFGWKQLPDMARSVGRSLRVFKTEIKGMTDDDKARDAVKGENVELEVPAQGKQLESRPKAAPRPAAASPVPAQVVRNSAASDAVAARPAGSRPRPAPSPNGRASAQ